MMPFISGEEILKTLNEDYPGIPAIMTTGVNEIETAVRCMRGGAFVLSCQTYQSWDQLRVAVSRAMKFRELEKSNEALTSSLLREELSFPKEFEKIKTISHNMTSIFKYIEAVAPSTHSILITGETGTGKELVAHAAPCDQRKAG